MRFAPRTRLAFRLAWWTLVAIGLVLLYILLTWEVFHLP